jgi:hypothetical protein
MRRSGERRNTRSIAEYGLAMLHAVEIGRTKTSLPLPKISAWGYITPSPDRNALRSL